MVAFEQAHKKFIKYGLGHIFQKQIMKLVCRNFIAHCQAHLMG